MIVLFTNQASNANSTATLVQHRAEYTTATLAAWGGFGGGTLTLRFSPDNGTTWLDFPTPVTLTAPGSKQQTIPTGVLIRGELTGATGSTLSANLYNADG
jgi:hypothetical protein